MQKEKNSFNIFSVALASQKHDALPRLLAFKIGDKVGEILMTNDGHNLTQWGLKISNHNDRV